MNLEKDDGGFVFLAWKIMADCGPTKCIGSHGSKAKNIP